MTVPTRDQLGAKVSRFPLYNSTCQNCDATPDKIYDCPTVWGPWAHLCEACAKRFGKPRAGTVHDVRRA